MTMILASLLGVALYLLTGMVLAHHTPLGRKYYPATPIRLTFFWIVPVIGCTFWGLGMLISIVLGDIFLFGDHPDNLGMDNIFD